MAHLLVKLVLHAVRPVEKSSGSIISIDVHVVKPAVFPEGVESILKGKTSGTAVKSMHYYQCVKLV